jgi:hypothetical protein
MKTNVLLALISVCILGCAQQPQTQTTAAADPSKRTYTNDQLMNTGRHDAAGQVQAIDPSVTVHQ